MHEKHFRELNLTSRASLAEVKTAYRTLSKKYHPDISTEDNCTDKFIAITESYVFLQKALNIRSPKEYAKINAQKYAEKKYADFQQTDLYQSTNIIYRGFGYLMLLTGAILIIFVIYGFILQLTADDTSLIAENTNLTGSILVLVFTIIIGLKLIYEGLSDIKGHRKTATNSNSKSPKTI